MVKKSKGFRTRTRNKLKQQPSVRPAITKFLQKFEIGQKVAIEPEPSSQKGMPYPKFKGSVGKVIGRRGNSYIVEINVGDSRKLIISRPEHLKAI
ncbi:MAG: 50S ribosomal protein L21e [Candidatus Aenigmatarchaeota archaeon]|nr:50S ribosomal protein L21e [Candidatus Aenigmarchaeota archaeon]